MKIHQSGADTTSQRPLAVLRQQVKNQSRECDFTIRMGTWSKRFHRSVLVEAEFFNALFRHSQFQENKTGSVEIVVGGCPENLETAIMFLYGCRRKVVTSSKIGHLLELADFLIIPEMKRLLAIALRRRIVTDDNCGQTLMLATLYDIDLSNNCDKFIRASLRTCLEKEEFLCLTKESVISLLSDDTLIYVGSDCKLKFVLKWLRHYGPAWSEAGKEMLELIDMDEVSEELMTEVQTDPVFQRYNVPIVNTSNTCQNRTVLLTCQNRNMLLAENVAYDIERSLWFRMDIKGYCLPMSYNRTDAIKGRSQLDNVVYLNTGFGVEIRDFITDSSTTTEFIIDGIDYIRPQYLDSRSRVNTKFISDAIHYSGRQYLDPCFYVNNGIVCAKIDQIHPESFSSEPKKYVSTLCTGVIHTDGGVTKLKPVLGFPFELEHQICINDSNCIACLRMQKVYIFDATLFTLDVLPVRYDTDSFTICPTSSGFVIYGNTSTSCFGISDDMFTSWPVFVIEERCAIDISRQQGPSLTSRYVVNKIELANHGQKTRVKYQYIYTDGMWIRYCEKDNLKMSIEWVSHDVFKLNTPIHELPWTPIPSLDNVFSYDFMKRSVKVSVPRSKLTCHLNCPHCRYDKNNQFHIDRIGK